MKKIFFYMLFAVVLSACNKNKRMLDCSDVKEMKISQTHQVINKEYLGQIEGICAKDSMLVTMDYHDGMSYTLFNSVSGDSILRFGEIGHGKGEIPLGCDISVCNDAFMAFDDETHIAATYIMNSDTVCLKSDVFKYKIENTQLTKLALTNNGMLLGMGTYMDKYQYVLFDRKGKVYDYAFELYNYEDKNFNKFHKFLSNQGKLVKHPSKDLYAGAVDFSSNIDFFSISKNKIKKTKEVREGNPDMKVESVGGLNRVIPTGKAINGFIDLAATESNVYALYSDELFKKIQYCSDTIFVFDWTGNVVCKMKMPNNVYYIAATSSRLFTVEKDMDGYFIIVSYPI